MSLAWTKKGLSALHPRQGGPNQPLKAPKFSVDKALEAMLARFAKLDPWDHFEKGRSMCTPECAELMRRVQHKLTDGLPEARQGPLDMELEPVMGAMQFVPVDETIWYWANLESPGFAAEALARSWQFSLHHAYVKGGGEVRYLTRRPAPSHERFDTGMAELDCWEALRRCLACTSPELYAEARERLQGLFEASPLGLQFALCYAFPDQAEWAAHCLRAALQDPFKGYYFVLLSCRINLEGALALLARSQPRSSFSKKYLSAYDFAVNAVDMQGEAVLPGLLRLLESELSDDRRTAVLAISQIDSAEAAQALAALLTDPKVRPQLVDYFKANAGHGRAVLEELGRGKGRLAEEAAAVAGLVY